MDSMLAFARGQVNKGKTQMVFNWDKAAKIIKETGATEAGAGLSGDWEWTGGRILANGKPIPKEDTYTYLASTWAIPELEVDGDVINCFIMADKTDWDSETYWPESALKILDGK